MAKYKLEVNREGCIACGACVSACPNLFVMEGKSKPKKPVIDEKEFVCAKRAADDCPVKVISITKKK